MELTGALAAAGVVLPLPLLATLMSAQCGMLQRGLSGRTTRHVHSAIHNALRQAVKKWRLISHNPAELVDLPKASRTERRVLSPEEAQKFLKTSGGMRHGLVFEFALLTGMRPEEYLALQWHDLDLERGTAQVRRALVRHKGSWSFEEPKTRKSRRTITLPPQLVGRLKAGRDLRRGGRALSGVGLDRLRQAGREVAGGLPPGDARAATRPAAAGGGEEAVTVNAFGAPATAIRRFVRAA